MLLSLNLDCLGPSERLLDGVVSVLLVPEQLELLVGVLVDLFLEQKLPCLGLVLVLNAPLKIFESVLVQLLLIPQLCFKF